MEIELSEDQIFAYEAIMQSIQRKDGRMFFLSGDAGTGKSTLVNKLSKAVGRYEVAKLAPTGMAAQNISGCTIHRYCTIHYATQEVRSVKQFRKNMRHKKFVIIDEISMVGQSMFETIIPMFKEYGVTILFVGDFFQLPPIKDRFAFQSDMWDVEHLHLTTNHRQSDEKFKSILKDIRHGKLTERVEEFVNARKVIAPEDALRISPYRSEVEDINNMRLQRTGEDIHVATARVSYKESFVKPESMFKGVRIPEVVKYSKKARVVMLTNDSEGAWVNGSTGVVEEVDDGQIMVRLDNNRLVNACQCLHQVFDAKGDVIFEYVQVPFQLGYALTIHKSQGCTLDRIVISLGGHFAPGMTYVAMSRCTTIEGVFLTGNMSTLLTDEIVVEYFKYLEST